MDDATARAREHLVADLLDDPVAPTLTASALAPATPRRASTVGPPVRVDVAWGDLVAVEADLHVVGHYDDVNPTASEAALDAAISAGRARGIIEEHTRRRWIPGGVGVVTYFPVLREPGVIRHAAVVGMGRPGTFRRRHAARLFESIVREVTGLGGLRTVATVLIGTGANNLTLSEGVTALVSGIADALGRPAGPPASVDLERLLVVERDLDRADAAHPLLRRAVQERAPWLVVGDTVVPCDGGAVSRDSGLRRAGFALARLAAVDEEGTKPVVDRALDPLPEREREEVRRRVDEITGQEEAELLPLAVGQDDEHAAPTRLSVYTDRRGLRWAAITDRSTVPERLVALDRTVLTDLTRRLGDATGDDERALTQVLSRLVVPLELQRLVTDGAAIVIEVDRESARLPWEFLTDVAGSPHAPDLPLAARTSLARQLRTRYAALPAPSDADRRRALVIGDPAGDGLRGARAEARLVARLLRDAGFDVTLYIGPVASEDAPGPVPERRADLLLVLGELLATHHEIVHFCGHGAFEGDDPERRAGWVFAPGLLTSHELAALQRPPRLVVANACLTAALSTAGTSGTVENSVTARAPAGASVTATATMVATSTESPGGIDDGDLLPGLADEFLRCGVAHYIGTAWEVRDDAALSFAAAFYEHMLGSETIGDAVKEARAVVCRTSTGDTNDWAAYQHYGDPSDWLVTDARTGRRS